MCIWSLCVFFRIWCVLCVISIWFFILLSICFNSFFFLHSIALSERRYEIVSVCGALGAFQSTSETIYMPSTCICTLPLTSIFATILCECFFFGQPLFRIYFIALDYLIIRCLTNGSIWIQHFKLNREWNRNSVQDSVGSRIPVLMQLNLDFWI